MKITGISDKSISDYLFNQLQVFGGTLSPSDQNLILKNMDEAMDRLELCINNVLAWPQGEFNILQSSQYCQFLYILSNTIWRNSEQHAVPTKLFLLNKCLNSIDCFYEINLPDFFYIPHSIGIVLSKATYGNYFVIHQNCTVGKIVWRQHPWDRFEDSAPMTVPMPTRAAPSMSCFIRWSPVGVRASQWLIFSKYIESH